MLLNLLFVLTLRSFCNGFEPEENPDLFEGDMILSPEQREAIINGSTFNKAIPLAATKMPWPRVIPYDLYGLRTNTEARKAIFSAIKEYHKHTCLRFIPRTKEREYIQFNDGKGCSSSVGYVPGRKNSVTLGRGCWNIGNAMHEILHSLGFYHEQSRPDRDKYVKIHLENVPYSLQNNFKKWGYDKVDSLGSPYDYGSVMHYPGNAFAGKKLSITTLDPSKQKLIGQRKGFSKYDIEQINMLYKCDEVPFMTTPVLPTVDPKCSDNYVFCDRYSFRCKLPGSNVWGRWARKDCRKTCKFC